MTSSYFDTLAHDNEIEPMLREVRETGFVRPEPKYKARPLPGYAMKGQDAHLVTHIAADVVIDCPDVTIGQGVTIERGTRISAKKLVIGDFAYIGDHVTLRAPEVRVGDYSRVNAYTYGGGRKPLFLGRNLYIGRGVYLDSNGGLTLQDNVAFGASSQVWTHCQHGDRVQGLNPRWHTERTLVIEKDAWCIGRVVVSNAERIGARALVLNESNVLCDIPEDTTWAGAPAKDVTHRLGPQFMTLTEDEKCQHLEDDIDHFEALYPQYIGQLDTAFDAVTRTYRKRKTAAEVSFLKWTTAKFVPAGEE